MQPREHLSLRPFFESRLARRLPSSAEEVGVHDSEPAINMNVEKFCDWARLIQAEYVEMPGLQLSKRQAQRLWSLDPRSCDLIFQALEASHFLKRRGNDSYVRADIEY